MICCQVTLEHISVAGVAGTATPHTNDNDGNDVLVRTNHRNVVAYINRQGGENLQPLKWKSTSSHVSSATQQVT